MKKTFVGSPKLHYNFKMFRVKYQNSIQAQRIRSQVMQKMGKYLQTCDGRLINVKQLKKCQELVFYFVTGDQARNQGWENYLKDNLLKNMNILPNVLQLGPSY